MLSENELYHQLKQNQPQAYGMFYRQVHGLCLPYSLNKGNSHEEAEDILHECLAIFIHNIRSGVFQFSEGVKLSTYFYGIFKNQCLKQYEKKQKRNEISLQTFQLSDGEESIGYLDSERGMTKLSEEDHYEEDRSWIFGNLQRAFNQLAEDCQKVLSWFYIDELSLREIGLRLNLSEASATVKRFKCAKYLRQRFKFDEE